MIMNEIEFCVNIDIDREWSSTIDTRMITSMNICCFKIGWKK